MHLVVILIMLWFFYLRSICSAISKLMLCEENNEIFRFKLAFFFISCVGLEMLMLRDERKSLYTLAEDYEMAPHRIHHVLLAIITSMC
jgi:hypothetical protein